VASFAAMTRTFQFVANAVRGLSSPKQLAPILGMGAGGTRRAPSARATSRASSPFNASKRVLVAATRLHSSAIVFCLSLLAAWFLDTRSDRPKILGGARSGHVFSSGRIKRLPSVPASGESREERMRQCLSARCRLASAL
jgi:hypothetical protein